MTFKRVLEKIGKWLLFLVVGVVTIFMVLFIIIKMNSSGTQEQFYDDNGDLLPNSIALHEDMVINGAPQRLTIRGKDISNPVLLRVHGGPGSSFKPFIYRMFECDLEDIFTVCYWDQRGSGPASKGEEPLGSINLEQIVDDGLGVTQF